MRGSTIVEAVIALAIGAGGGAAFLMGTGDLKGANEISRLESEKGQLEQTISQHHQELAHRQQLIAEAEAAKVKAEAEAKAKAEADAAEAKAKAEAEAKAKAEHPVEKMPAFGLLTVKALSGDLDVDGGPGLTGRGKTVDLAFDAQPGKIKVKTGKFTVVLTPKVGPRALGVDVTVSPLAIITADGNRLGTSAPNLQIDKKPFKLDFSSPAAGDLNLLLTYKK